MSLHSPHWYQKDPSSSKHTHPFPHSIPITVCLPRQQHTSPLQFSCENVHGQWRTCGKTGKHLCPCTAAATKVTADPNLDRCHVNSDIGDCIPQAMGDTDHRTAGLKC